MKGLLLAVATAAAAAIAVLVGPGAADATFTFIRDDPTTGIGDVWTSHADGSGLRQLTDTSEPEAFASWSPDGTTIFFGRVVTSGVFNIYSVDAVTGQEQLLLRDSPPTTYSVAYPSWQPLGKL
jgi:Tol biopolymer transport system component